MAASRSAALKKSFSRHGDGRIFLLFSRVMRDGLSTGPCAERPESVLSGPILSKANDYADLVLSFMALNMNGYFQMSFWSVCENVCFADRTGVGTMLSKMASRGASLEVIRRLLVHTLLPRPSFCTNGVQLLHGNFPRAVRNGALVG